VEAELFEAAPEYDRKRPNKPRNPDAPSWQDCGCIIAMQPWYPGDVKSFKVEDLFVSPDSIEDADHIAGNRGW